jgi:hypothetical protein
VSERLCRCAGGLEGGGGAEPPCGGSGAAPPIFFFFFFLPGRHISGTTYYRDDIFPGPHDI